MQPSFTEFIPSYDQKLLENPGRCSQSTPELPHTGQPEGQGKHSLGAPTSTKTPERRTKRKQTEEPLKASLQKQQKGLPRCGPILWRTPHTDHTSLYLFLALDETGCMKKTACPEEIVSITHRFLMAKPAKTK